MKTIRVPIFSLVFLALLAGCTSPSTSAPTDAAKTAAPFIQAADEILVVTFPPSVYLAECSVAVGQTFSILRPAAGPITAKYDNTMLGELIIQDQEETGWLFRARKAGTTDIILTMGGDKSEPWVVRVTIQ